MGLLDFLREKKLFTTDTPEAFKVGEITKSFGRTCRITKIKFYGVQELIAPPWTTRVYKVYGVPVKNMRVRI